MNAARSSASLSPSLSRLSLAARVFKVSRSMRRPKRSQQQQQQRQQRPPMFCSSGGGRPSEPSFAIDVAVAVAAAAASSLAPSVARC